MFVATFCVYVALCCNLDNFFLFSQSGSFYYELFIFLYAYKHRKEYFGGKF